MGNKKTCLKYIGPVRIGLASATCKSTPLPQNYPKATYKLPLPKNKKENDDLVNFFRTQKIRTDGVPTVSKEYARYYFAIDLNDVLTEGKFVTSDGQEPTYTNWKYPAPNDKTKPGSFIGEDYVAVGTDGTYLKNGKWNDINERFYIALICQQECY